MPAVRQAIRVYGRGGNPRNSTNARSPDDDPLSNDISYSLALSVCLGLLIGLQRQWRESEVAGIRTFPLITLLGTLIGLIEEGEPGWLAAAGLVGTAAMLILANAMKLLAAHRDVGITTEMAALLMYIVGVALASDLTGPAIVTAGAATVLLHWKRSLHEAVARIGDQDFRGIVHLVLLALVILPVLPDRTYGPFDVLNPYRIWLMVVLIVGISMAAYVTSKLLGPRVGTILGGIFGGLVSSTATTISYARRTRVNASEVPTAAIVILIASAVLNLRILVEIGAIAPRLLQTAAAPVVMMFLLISVEAALLYWPLRNRTAERGEHGNPTQIRTALTVGALYALILFVVAAVQQLYGQSALYTAGFISGLVNVDAITLSTAHLFEEGRVPAGTAWRVILVATLGNLLFKLGVVAFLGARRLLWYTGGAFLVAAVGAGALLAFWPDTEFSIGWPAGDEQAQVEDAEAQSASTSDAQAGSAASEERAREELAPEARTADMPVREVPDEQSESMR